MKDFKAIGINRLSIGVQALNDADLKYLGRNHTVKEAEQTIKLARDLDWRVSFDLIYARHPQQTVESWREELQVNLVLLW